MLGSRVKFLAHEADGGYRVSFVGAKLARDYDTRASDVIVTASEAELVAIRSEQGQTLDTFTEPELVAIASDGKDLGNARMAWSVVGSLDGSLAPSWTFKVDAVTGALLSARINAAYATDTISGTVSGGATPGLRPDMGSGSCPNPAAQVDVPWAQVELVDGSQSLATVYTDSDGDYTMSLGTIPSSADVVFHWAGPAWQVYLPISPMTPAPPTTVGVSGTFPEVIDHNFNPDPETEELTAQVNCMIHVGKAWRFYRDRLDSNQTYPGLDDQDLGVLPNVDASAFPFIGWYFPAHSPGGTPTINFNPKTVDHENAAYSTIIAHEYSHYILHITFGIPIGTSGSDPQDGAFHEGFADVVSHLIYGTETIAEDIFGCDTCIREPLVSDPIYPMCYDSMDPFVDSCNGISLCADHVRGMLLSSIWLELQDLLGFSTTSQLFVDWAMITGGGRPGPDDCNAPPGCSQSNHQSADVQTLIEVLTADDDDNDITNGTPHGDDICAAFAARGIEPHPSLGLCGDSAGGGRACSIGDLNQDGRLSLEDFVMFAALCADGSRLADLNGDGAVDFVDQLVFQNAYVEGCR